VPAERALMLSRPLAALGPTDLAAVAAAPRPDDRAGDAAMLLSFLTHGYGAEVAIGPAARRR
jgi:hypothetical protein